MTTSSADQLLLAAIRKHPGRTLNAYALDLCLTNAMARLAVDSLLTRGDIRRHSHTEQLTPAGAPSAPSRAVLVAQRCGGTGIDASPASAALREHIDSLVVDAAVPTAELVAHPPMSLTALQRQLLELLGNGDMVTVDLVRHVECRAVALGRTLSRLRDLGLVSSSGPIGHVVWHRIGDIPPAPAPKSKPVSSAQKLRDALRDHGVPLTSRELEQITGVRVAIISALLAKEVALGAVRRSHPNGAHACLWMWNFGADYIAPPNIQDAVRLLEASGYVVQRAAQAVQ